MHPSWNHNYAQIARDSGFKFQQCDDGTLNWKLISSINIDKIIKEKNFENIENILYHLSEVPLGVLLNNQILDIGIIKYFHLSQLSLQYLLFCIKFLDETILTLRKSLKDLQYEKDEYHKLYMNCNQELLKLHQKCEYLENLNEIIYPCSICTKNFISNDMLNLHMKKRHSNINNNQQQTSKDSTKKSEINDRNLINTIKLELEIKQLKEKLNCLIEEKEANKKSSVCNYSYSHHQSCHQLEFDEMKKSKIDKAINASTNACSEIIKVADGLQNLNASTQTTSTLVEVKNIGIQNNLNEIKEKNDDDHDHEIISNVDQKRLYNILTEIKDGISDLSKNVHNKDDNDTENIEIVGTLENQQKIQFNSMEVYDKLNQILYSIENMNLKHSRDTLDDNDDEHIEQDKKKFLEYNLQLIQNTIKENILKSNYVNEVKMNDMLKKFEAKLQESLVHIAGNQHSKKFVMDSTVTASKVASKSKVDSVKTLDLASKLNDYSDAMLGNEFERNKYQKKRHIDDDDQDEKSDFVKTLKNSEVNSRLQRTQTNSGNVIFKKPNPITFTKNDCLKILNSRIKKLGINPNQNSITDSDKSRVSKRLDELHRNQKLKYSKFLITRNKVKRWVDRISSEKIKAKGRERKTNEVLKEENVITDNQNTEQIKNEKKFTLDDNLEEQDLNRFKLRLEKILESPIRKPNIMHDSYSATNLDDKKEQHLENIKPIPAPRKVTFNKISEKCESKISKIRAHHDNE